MTPAPLRRDLMRPVQLLGIAFACALFAGAVTAVSMGVFQTRSPEQAPRAIVVSLIVFGVTFIVVLLALAMLMLAIDPAEYEKTIDRPVLLPPEDVEGEMDASNPTGDEPREPDVPR